MAPRGNPTCIDPGEWLANSDLVALRAVLADILDIDRTSPVPGRLVHFTRRGCWSHRCVAQTDPNAEAVPFWTAGGNNRILKANAPLLRTHFEDPVIGPYIAFLETFPVADRSDDTTNVSVDRFAVWEDLPTLSQHLRRLAAASVPDEIQQHVAEAEGRVPIQHNAARRDAVEQYSMLVALSYYRHLYGESNVADVHATNPFDILCHTADGKLQVEVKGSGGLGNPVIVTEGELRASSRTRTVLFVVRNIQRTADGIGCVPGSGVIELHADWSVALPDIDPSLRALTFSYTRGIPTETIVVADLPFSLAT